jgi:hypothetical protein
VILVRRIAIIRVEEGKYKRDSTNRKNYGLVGPLWTKIVTDVSTANALKPLYVYLECGALGRIAINLIAPGLSRATALALRGKIQLSEDSTPAAV